MSVNVPLPSLREHRDDIPELAEHTLASVVEASKTGSRRFTSAALNALQGVSVGRVKVTFALRPLARQLPRAPDRFGLLSCFPLGRLLVVAAKLHLSENALALHLLLQRLESLVDVVVAYLYQQAVLSLIHGPHLYGTPTREMLRCVQPPCARAAWSRLHAIAAAFTSFVSPCLLPAAPFAPEFGRIRPVLVSALVPSTRPMLNRGRCRIYK